jgi:hypothetical protein
VLRVPASHPPLLLLLLLVVFLLLLQVNRKEGKDDR